MSYRGALPPGQSHAYPGQQQDQRYSAQNGYYYSPQGQAQPIPQSQQFQQSMPYGGGGVGREMGQVQQHQPQYQQQQHQQQVQQQQPQHQQHAYQQASQQMYQQQPQHVQQHQQHQQSQPGVQNYQSNMYQNYQGGGNYAQGMGQPQSPGAYMMPNGSDGWPNSQPQHQHQQHQQQPGLQQMSRVASGQMGRRTPQQQHGYSHQTMSPQTMQQHLPRQQSQQPQHHMPSPQNQVHSLHQKTQQQQQQQQQAHPSPQSQMHQLHGHAVPSPQAHHQHLQHHSPHTDPRRLSQPLRSPSATPYAHSPPPQQQRPPSQPPQQQQQQYRPPPSQPQPQPQPQRRTPQHHPIPKPRLAQQVVEILDTPEPTPPPQAPEPELPPLPPPPVPEPEPQPIAEPEPEPEPEPVPELEPEPPQFVSFADTQHNTGFVNMADIQKLPPLPLLTTMDPMNMDLSNGTDIRTELKEETPKKPQKPPPSSPDPLSLPHKSKMEHKFGAAEDAIVVAQPVLPRPASSITQHSPLSSGSKSPSLAKRSPGITKKSPSSANSTRVSSVHMMVAVAEELLTKARTSVHDVAMSGDSDLVSEYEGMISTGLACLKAAMQANKLTPREEARLRLRYAVVVQEETEELMEAETTLNKAVALCDQHRLHDLKYCMRYQMLKALFDKSPKAALTATDKQISDCEAYKHTQWSYAFRLLKASFHMHRGTGADASAVENLRSIHATATKRGDNALGVYASLVEALAFLRSAKQDNIEKIRNCIAQAAKFQLDPSVKIIQLEILMMVLDIASTLHRDLPEITSQKLRRLQSTLDEDESWHNVKSEFLIPIQRQTSGGKLVTNDTSAILRPGTGDCDYLVMSFMTKMEMTTLVFTLSGLVHMHKSSAGLKSNDLWHEGLKILDTWDDVTVGKPYGPSISLKTAVEQRQWRLQSQAYYQALLGLLEASRCRWKMVQTAISRLSTILSQFKTPILEVFSIYLAGVYQQGTGDLQAALHTFLDPSLALFQKSPGPVGQREIAILSGMNRLWIMQHPSCRNDQETLDLVEQLQPICKSHPDMEIRIAWNNVMSPLITNPPQLMNDQKQHLQEAVAGVRVTNNVMQAAITLCNMRNRFFENVVGEQALKSARAADKQAQRSGNELWKSVASGLLAQSHDLQGQRDEALSTWEKATQEAINAFAGSL